MDGVICKIDKPTDWCAGIVIVPMPNGTYRICVDLNRLNQVVKKEHRTLPSVGQILRCLAGEAKVSSKVDAAAEFREVKLAGESQELANFITPFGR